MSSNLFLPRKYLSVVDFPMSIKILIKNTCVRFFGRVIFLKFENSIYIWKLEGARKNYLFCFLIVDQLCWFVFLF